MGFYPRPIATKLAPVIDYGLKFAAFASLVSPGGGAFANFALPWGPGGRAFANHLNITTQSILLEKQDDWLICQG